MNAIFTKTFSELTAAEPLEIRDLGKTVLSPAQLAALYSVVDYRFENMLPTVTYTSLKAEELTGAICRDVQAEPLARAILARLWEMGLYAA